MLELVLELKKYFKDIKPKSSIEGALLDIFISCLIGMYSYVMEREKNV